jgi:hypothetical protein
MIVSSFQIRGYRLFCSSIETLNQLQLPRSDDNLNSASSNNVEIKVWQRSDHAELRTLTFARETFFCTVAVTPYGRLLAAGGVSRADEEEEDEQDDDDDDSDDDDDDGSAIFEL